MITYLFGVSCYYILSRGKRICRRLSSISQDITCLAFPPCWELLWNIYISHYFYNLQLCALYWCALHYKSMRENVFYMVFHGRWISHHSSPNSTLVACDPRGTRRLAVRKIHLTCKTIQHVYHLISPSSLASTASYSTSSIDCGHISPDGRFHRSGVSVYSVPPVLPLWPSRSQLTSLWQYYFICDWLHTLMGVNIM